MFALTTLLRAAVGVPILAGWWRPSVDQSSSPGSLLLWSPLVLTGWTVAALAAYSVGGEQAFAVEVVESSEPVLLLGSMLVAAPLFEELLFRGILLDRLRQWSTVGAVLVTSFVWVLVHFHYSLVALAIMYAMGAVLAAARLYTGALWVPIVMHAWWNGCVLFAAGLRVVDYAGLRVF